MNISQIPFFVNRGLLSNEIKYLSGTYEKYIIGDRGRRKVR